MASSKTSSTSASSLARLAAWALAAVVGGNLWVGANLASLLQRTEVGTFADLAGRVGRVPHPERVKLLVFGNSHAQHALRPPSLAPALGLEADEIFNLAIPGTTAFELSLHARHWAPRFPAARQAIICVDEVLLTVFPWFQQGRVKWLSRDVPARLRYAGYFQDLEGQFTTVAWLPLPVADFAQSLRASFRSDRSGFLRRLLFLEPAVAPGDVALADYRWGLQPLAERPERERRLARRHKMSSPAYLGHLADIFFSATYARARSLEDLEAACRTLESRGIEVKLVTPQYAPALRALLHRERRADLEAHREALGGYLRATGRTLYVPACEPPPAAYIDADHLAEAGAAQYARATAEALGARP